MLLRRDNDRTDALATTPERHPSVRHERAPGLGGDPALCPRRAAGTRVADTSRYPDRDAPAQRMANRFTTAPSIATYRNATRTGRSPHRPVRMAPASAARGCWTQRSAPPRVDGAPKNAAGASIWRCVGAPAATSSDDATTANETGTHQRRPREAVLPGAPWWRCARSAEREQVPHDLIGTLIIVGRHQHIPFSRMAIRRRDVRRDSVLPQYRGERPSTVTNQLGTNNHRSLADHHTPSSRYRAYSNRRAGRSPHRPVGIVRSSGQPEHRARPEWAVSEITDLRRSIRSRPSGASDEMNGATRAGISSGVSSMQARTLVAAWPPRVGDYARLRPVGTLGEIVEVAGLLSEPPLYAQPLRSLTGGARHLRARRPRTGLARMDAGDRGQLVGRASPGRLEPPTAALGTRINSSPPAEGSPQSATRAVRGSRSHRRRTGLLEAQRAPRE